MVREGGGTECGSECPDPSVVITVGEPPTRFEVVKDGWLRVLVRRDVAGALVPLLRRWSVGGLPPARPVSGGRGGAAVFDVAPGLTVVLRHCRRGGMVSWVDRDVYFGVRPRPFRELRVTETLRQRRVPVVEVLAAGVSWLAPGLYRGALVSREVPGAVNLWQYLQSVNPDERGSACYAAAMATRQLHDAGAVHPDLNLQNYLVRRGARGREVLIIDCDRVRLHPASTRSRRAAFARLCRSMRRLDPQSAVITLGCVEAFQAVEKEEVG